MGVYDNINFEKFPKQGSHLGKRVRVCFQYDTSRYVYGTVVRDDAEARIFGDNESPGIELFALDDGRYVLSTECQYSTMRTGDKEVPYVVPGSIDDPQSLAYDMANAPFNQNEMPIPHGGYWWMQLDRDPIWLLANRCLYEERYEADVKVAAAIAEKYGADRLCGNIDKTTGVTKFIGFLMKDSDVKPGTRAFRGQEMKRARQRRANVWDYQPYDANKWIKIPRPSTKQGKAALADLRAVEEKVQTGFGTFATFILKELGMQYVIGEHLHIEIRTRVVIADRKVFVGIPQNPETFVDLEDKPLLPVNYSEVALAIEKTSQDKLEDSDDEIESW